MFSFLDAMVCTMGALLVLVHAFARHGQVQAIKSPEVQAARENTASMAAELETLEWRSEQLRGVREKTQAQLAEERQKLSHVEEHQRRLLARLAELQIAAAELERNGGSRSKANNQVSAELEAAKSRISHARDELDKARKNALQGSANYSVVPYEGPHATRRRPIYIECRGDSIVLQPEGIELLPDHFAGYLGPGNPLASAVRATSEYWAKQSPGGKQVEPYPLLLVRPEGIQSYYDARVALSTWGSDFGYELIGGDWSLKFPERDERLAQITREVVADSAVRMRALVNSMAQMTRRRPPRTALHASAGGGFVEDRGVYGRDRGRSTGQGPGDWNAAGSGWSRGGGEDEDETSLGGPRGGGVGSPGNLPGTAGGRGGFGSPDGTGGQGGAGEDFAMHGSRYGDSPGDNGGDGTTSADQESLTGRYSEGGATRPGGKLGGPYGTSGGSADDSNSKYSGGAGDPSKYNSATRQGSRTSSTAASDSANGTAGSSANSSSTSASSGSAGSSSSSDSQQQSVSAGVPNPSLDLSPKKKRTSSMAKTRGSNWGLPESSGTAAATRPISVECYNDHLLILPEERSQPAVSVRMNEHAQESMDEFVSGVWQHMKAWGKAGKGLYWRPTLLVEVKPGAADRYAEVKSLLEDSGLDVHERVPPVTALPPARKPVR
jgi:hypothetical protein